jgi:hypothetical protein
VFDPVQVAALTASAAATTPIATFRRLGELDNVDRDGWPPETATFAAPAFTFCRARNP